MHVDYIHSAQRLGIEQGIEQGIKQGIEQGITLGVQRVVLGMFSRGVPINDIASMTGMSEESLRKSIEKQC